MNHPAWRRLTTVQIAAQTQNPTSLSWTGRSRSVPFTRMKKRKGQGGEEDLCPSPEVQCQLGVSSHWINGHHMASSLLDIYHLSQQKNQSVWAQLSSLYCCSSFTMHRIWICHKILYIQHAIIALIFGHGQCFQDCHGFSDLSSPPVLSLTQKEIIIREEASLSGFSERVLSG